MNGTPNRSRASRSCLAAVSLTFLALSGCQSGVGVANLDRISYAPQLYDARGLLFETDRRYVVMQFTQSPMDGVVDSDSYIGYVSLPVRDGWRLDFDDPGLAVGWSNLAIVFSDMFDRKSVSPYERLPYDWLDVPEVKFDPMLLLPAPVPARPLPASPGGVDAGRQLEIVDYRALMRSSLFKVEFGAPDAEDRLTD